MMTDRDIVVVRGTQVQVRDAQELAKGAATWRDVLATFVATQDVKKSSRSTYVRTLTQFFQWVEESRRNLASLTRQDILCYKDELLEKGLSPLTVSSYLVSLRRFYEWAEAEKIYPNIAKAVKSPKKSQEFKKQHLPETKIKELLTHFEANSKRDFAIVNLVLRTGLRTIEVSRLRVQDISFEGERRVLRIWGKGHDSADSFVVLTDKAYEPIKDYLQTRKGYKQGEPLFLSVSNRNTSGAMTTRSISRICKEGLRAVNLDGKEFSAHSLRHTTAVTILKSGGSLTDVQDVLRHKSVTTSQIYVESFKKEQRLKNAPETRLDDAF